MSSKLNELLRRKEKDSHRVTAYLTPETFQSFKTFCKNGDMTMSECINALIEDAMHTHRAQVVPMSQAPQKLRDEG